MKRVFYSIIIILTFHFCIFCQKNDYIWLGGYESGPTLHSYLMTFHTWPNPVNYKKDSLKMNFRGLVNVLSDDDGNLKYYSNGISIKNHEYNFVKDGDTIGFNQDWVSYNSIGLPNTQYGGAFKIDSFYFFYHELLFNILPYKVNFNIVVNNEIIKKDFSIVNNTNIGHASTVKSADGKNYWVLVSDLNFEKFYICKMSNLNYLIDSVQFSFKDFGNNNISINRFSPNGNIYARNVYGYGIWFYDFDRCSGQLSNRRELITGYYFPGGGCAFSANSQFFYFCSYKYIFQVDLKSPILSMDTVAEYDGFQSPFPTTFATMELGPDGRIYILSGNGTNRMGVIQHPNKKGIKCEVRQHDYNIASANAALPYFPNFRLGTIDGSPCDTLGINNVPLAQYRYDKNGPLVEFTNNSWYEPDWYIWDFGDGSLTSSEIDPFHTYTATGTYEVCLIAGNNYGQDTFCRPVVIDKLSETNDPPPLFMEDPGYSIYPNPTKNFLYITVPLYDILNKDTLSIIIYNQYGNEISKLQDIHELNRLDTSNFIAGVYLVSIIKNDRVVWKEIMLKL